MTTAAEITTTTTTAEMLFNENRAYHCDES
jgi:hypothetical protein